MGWEAQYLAQIHLGLASLNRTPTSSAATAQFGLSGWANPSLKLLSKRTNNPLNGSRLPITSGPTRASAVGHPPWNWKQPCEYDRWTLLKMGDSHDKASLWEREKIKKQPIWKCRLEHEKQDVYSTINMSQSPQCSSRSTIQLYMTISPTSHSSAAFCIRWRSWIGRPGKFWLWGAGRGHRPKNQGHFKEIKNWSPWSFGKSSNAYD